LPSAVTTEQQTISRRGSDTVVLFSIAAAIALLHIFTNSRYGFHRDELQFLSDARHLDWGFVAYPPLTPFLEHIGMSLFGLSMVGLRLFSVLAQATAVFVTGLMARDLGGSRIAQVTAALAVAFSGLPLFSGTEFQYTSFDFLWWVLISFFIVRLLTSEDPRWWLAIGAAVGLGLLTKYAIVFYIAGILSGVALTSARRYFKTGWFWGGIALALATFLPNFIWLLRHDFISYHFLQSIHARDVRIGRAAGFWKDQFLVCTNPAAAPLWIAGFVAFARSSRYRMLAILYAVPVLLFWLGKGRGYYTAGAYPMLLAMGAVIWQRRLGDLPRAVRFSLTGVYFAAFAAISLYISAVVIPFASSGPLRNFALSHNWDLREEIGWGDLVRTVAQIRDSLPPDQQAHLGIAVGNYGEAGAIEILGSAYRLPRPISTVNSFWYRGYPTPAPTTIILLGNSRERADELFTNCRLAGHNGNSEGVSNEESTNHSDIFVCGPPRKPWSKLWASVHDFG
jgi:hypothetical protein